VPTIKNDARTCTYTFFTHTHTHIHVLTHSLHTHTPLHIFTHTKRTHTNAHITHDTHIRTQSSSGAATDVAARGGAGEGCHAPLGWLLEGGGEELWTFSLRVGDRALDLLWSLQGQRVQEQQSEVVNGGLGEGEGEGEEGRFAGEGEGVAEQGMEAGTFTDTPRLGGGSQTPGVGAGSYHAASSALMALVAASPLLLQPRSMVRALATVEGWEEGVVRLGTCPLPLSQGQDVEGGAGGWGEGGWEWSSQGNGTEGGPGAVMGGSLLLQVCVCLCVFVCVHVFWCQVRSVLLHVRACDCAGVVAFLHECVCIVRACARACAPALLLSMCVYMCESMCE